MLYILSWIGGWIMIGLVTQFIIRLVQWEKVFAGPEYYFWSAVAGPFVTIVAILFPLIDRYTSLLDHHGPEEYE